MEESKKQKKTTLPGLVSSPSREENKSIDPSSSDLKRETEDLLLNFGGSYVPEFLEEHQTNG